MAGINFREHIRLHQHKWQAKRKKTSPNSGRIKFETRTRTFSPSSVISKIRER